MAIRYKKTADSNIVKKIETVESEIHLDKLAKQIADLETEVEDLEEQLCAKPPSDAALLEWARECHPHFLEKPWFETKIEKKKQRLNVLRQAK